MLVNNGNLSPELAEKLLLMMSQIDEGNNTIMTDSFNRFIRLFPDHRKIANNIYERETCKPLLSDEERVSRRGY